MSIKRKVALKYRNSAAKRIRLAKLKARATKLIVLNSDSSDNESNCKNFTGFDPEIEDSFEREIDFQKNDTFNLNPSNPSLHNFDFSNSNNENNEREVDLQETGSLNSDANLNSNFSDNSISNNENVIRDNVNDNRSNDTFNDDVEQDYNEQNDVDVGSNLDDERQQNNYLLNMLRKWALRGVSKKKVDEFPNST